MLEPSEARCVQLTGRLDQTYSIDLVEAPFSVCEPLRLTEASTARRCDMSLVDVATRGSVLR